MPLFSFETFAGQWTAVGFEARVRARFRFGPAGLDLLVYLVHNRERVVSKDDLLSVREVGDSGEEQRLMHRTVARKGSIQSARSEKGSRHALSRWAKRRPSIEVVKPPPKFWAFPISHQLQCY